MKEAAGSLTSSDSMIDGPTVVLSPFNSILLIVPSGA
jgi:hypothetical protein